MAAEVCSTSDQGTMFIFAQAKDSRPPAKGQISDHEQAARLDVSSMEIDTVMESVAVFLWTHHFSGKLLSLRLEKDLPSVQVALEDMLAASEFTFERQLNGAYLIHSGSGFVTPDRVDRAKEQARNAVVLLSSNKSPISTSTSVKLHVPRWGRPSQTPLLDDISEEKLLSSQEISTERECGKKEDSNNPETEKQTLEDFKAQVSRKLYDVIQLEQPSPAKKSPARSKKPSFNLLEEPPTTRLYRSSSPNVSTKKKLPSSAQYNLRRCASSASELSSGSKNAMTGGVSSIAQPTVALHRNAFSMSDALEYQQRGHSQLYGGRSPPRSPTSPPSSLIHQHALSERGSLAPICEKRSLETQRAPGPNTRGANERNPFFSSTEEHKKKNDASGTRTLSSICEVKLAKSSGLMLPRPVVDQNHGLADVGRSSTSAIRLRSAKPPASIDRSKSPSCRPLQSSQQRSNMATDTSCGDDIAPSPPKLVSANSTYRNRMQSVGVVPQYNKNGRRLSDMTRAKMAKMRRLCLLCGHATHEKKGMLGLVWKPITNDKVHKGQCIQCSARNSAAAAATTAAGNGLISNAQMLELLKLDATPKEPSFKSEGDTSLGSCGMLEEESAVLTPAKILQEGGVVVAPS
eukprot:CAMPEP_0172446832 /NCGR_PEP_ID=MMETSP1065-20121228/6318_1 /TAXON_ID=265537 /ORGANISM="Amphiprora paludosa, Strain CCMP125" /LENGTH=630 /DNA_ID=CAMNT_0013198021 /DNA_START=21 /DNA_END=1913 /DNA_ORIENTATION=+